jgi:hypothetical protein
VRLGYCLQGADGRLDLEETLELPFAPRLQSVDVSDLDAALEGLHLIGGISYWKTCCPTHIRLDQDTLTEWDSAFWNEVYSKGLGEFFFRNRIAPEGRVVFPRGAPAGDALTGSTTPGARALLLVGGGKDSIVSHVILRHGKLDHHLFYVGRGEHIEPLIASIRAPLLIVRRRLDPKLFELNAAGALNGHVPVSAYYAFAAQLVAVLEGFGALVASNERSASSGNLRIGEFEVNHQWSKGIRFETLFQQWQHCHLRNNPLYFSLLRPLSELGIAQGLARYPRHFPFFSSCNRNFRQTDERASQRWCGRCSKCLFVYIMLAPWIDDETLQHIFAGNLLANEENLAIVAELLGVEGHKPFDCVGTPDEVAAALWLCHAQGRYRDAPLMEYFVNRVLPGIADPEALVEAELTLSADHRLPLKWLHRLQSFLKEQ